jgi:hypothetical protein
MKIYKSKIDLLTQNINVEMIKFRKNNRNIKNFKNNKLQKKLYLLTEKMIEKKIANYEKYRIDYKINYLKCKKLLENICYEKKRLTNI